MCPQAGRLGADLAAGRRDFRVLSVGLRWAARRRETGRQPSP